MSYNLFLEQLELITATTRMLNDAKLPADEHHYINVQLLDVHDGQVVGKWSDEIGNDSWSFELVGR